ncbi:uncharacterized protein PSFLO_02451 [Pseudozyma flocculosa]|uniref:Uncharacterized protein n=1 Tax=Pseudozyma flocculosa TaxID=84751 RepID=A0A5C3F0L1_9BASI|nr:uncharacterized protein PSFLO_02451 [Pseudozyma flocculosa]
MDGPWNEGGPGSGRRTLPGPLYPPSAASPPFSGRIVLVSGLSEIAALVCLEHVRTSSARLRLSSSGASTEAGQPGLAKRTTRSGSGPRTQLACTIRSGWGLGAVPCGTVRCGALLDGGGQPMYINYLAGILCSYKCNHITWPCPQTWLEELLCQTTYAAARRERDAAARSRLLSSLSRKPDNTSRSPPFGSHPETKQGKDDDLPHRGCTFVGAVSAPGANTLAPQSQSAPMRSPWFEGVQPGGTS